MAAFSVATLAFIVSLHCTKQSLLLFLCSFSKCTFFVAPKYSQSALWLDISQTAFQTLHFFPFPYDNLTNVLRSTTLRFHYSVSDHLAWRWNGKNKSSLNFSLLIIKFYLPHARALGFEIILSQCTQVIYQIDFCNGSNFTLVSNVQVIYWRITTRVFGLGDRGEVLSMNLNR